MSTEIFLSKSLLDQSNLLIFTVIYYWNAIFVCRIVQFGQLLVAALIKSIAEWYIVFDLVDSSHVMNEFVLADITL